MLAGRADDLRNHVAGALDDDEIALTDALAIDVLFVVQRCRGDGDAADLDRVELCPRIQRARPADANVDSLQRRDRRRGRPLEGPRPARSLMQGAEPLLLVERVDLDDDPVDLVVEAETTLLPGLAGGGDLPDRLEALDQRIRAESAFTEPGERRELRVGPGTVANPGPVDPDRKRPFGRDHRVQLPERPGRSVARVRRRLLAGGDLSLRKAREAAEGEIHLAAHFEHRRRALAVRDTHAQRNRLDRAQVGGHVLTAEAVASGGPASEDTVLVDERDR